MVSSRWHSLLQDRRFIVLLMLGFSSGLPLMLISRALKVWARDVGIDLTTLQMFSLVMLPYSIKFLWSPLMDWLNPLPRALGRRRAWLLVTQLLTMLAIGGMAMVGPSAGGDGLTRLALLALLTAFCSASQDIVADAYRTDILRPEELGIGASLFTSGYRCAMLASGAGAVFLADHIPWSAVYLIAALGMSIGIVATWLAPEPADSSRVELTFRQSLIEPFNDFVFRHGAGIVIVAIFILLFKLPDYLAGNMTDVFMLDLGFSKEQIAFWVLGVGVALMIPGAVLGGALVTWLGLRNTLLVCGIAQAASNAGYLWLAHAGARHDVLLIAIGVESLCQGLVAAGFIAFLMSQCTHRYSATQYALLSGLMSLSNALAGAASGFLADRLGYSAFFALTIVAAAPGLILLRWLPLPPDFRHR